MALVSARQADPARIARARTFKLALQLTFFVVGLVVLYIASLLAGRRPPACSPNAILSLEFAGADHVRQVYECWRDGRPSLSSTLLVDSVLFIPLYVLFLLYWCREARTTAITRHAKTIAGAATVGVLAAAVFDLAENLSLWQVDRSRGADEAAADRALAFTLPKWILVGFVAFVALQSFVRVMAYARAKPRPGIVFRARGSTAWERNTHLPHHDTEPPPNAGPPHGIGIAFSGGGIRSASFGMGALQALHETERTGPAGTLDDVRYLSGVSGGGYLVGARQLLLWDPRHRRGRPEGVGRLPEPFQRGSFEVEYVRRHGRYIADSAPEWIEAGARVLAGVLLNVGFLVALLYAIATPSGWLQRSFLFRSSRPEFEATTGMWLGVAVTLGIAAVGYVLAVLARPRTDTVGADPGSLLYRFSAIFAATGVICLALVFLLPWIAVVTSDLIGDVSSSAIATSGGLLSAAATWLGLRPPTRVWLSRLLRKKIEDQAPELDDQHTKETEGLRRKTWAAKVRLSRWLPGLLLLLTAAFILARFVARARRIGTGEPIRLPLVHLAPGSELLWWVAALVLLVLLFAFADQTSWSLHPYYKRRLATAFAMTRVGAEVVPLDYAVSTSLDEAGKNVRGPSLILGAAANLSGESAPPGRRALSYVFTPEWVGGPEIGYTTPETLRTALGSNAGDATLVAAMAISGAALASAMGRHSLGSLNSVMAAFNLRLGVWLPSPLHIDRMRTGDLPPPGLRRLTYVIRELFGAYDQYDRFLYVTDGGHVENLGLVELLRRRCKTVVCFDGSGGPDTLLEGVRLAYEELGVQIEFPAGSYAIVREGSAPADPTVPKDVSARMAATSVLVGRLHYPGLGEDLPAGTGTIVYARSVLTPRTSAEVLDHAARNARFPNDPTGDQWFDVEQFNNYVALGWEIGARAVEALEATP